MKIMAKLLINDIFDELNCENSRLLSESKKLQKYYYLLEKYRNLSINLQNICLLNRIQINESILVSLENEYKCLRDGGYKTTVGKVNGQHSADIPNQLGTDLNNDIQRDEEEVKTNGRDKSDVKLSHRFVTKVMKKRGKYKKDVMSCDEEKVEPTKSSYACDYVGCGRLFATRSYLEIHKKRRHTLVKPHNCFVCNKCFVTNEELKSHLLIHSENKKAFHCFQCDKWFARRQGLFTHNKYNHSSEATLLKCVSCDYETRDKHHLKAHTHRMHNPNVELRVKCDVEDCLKMFRDSNLMKRHKKYFHSGKNFVCDWPGCGQTFRGKYTYEDHHRSHVGLREFKCDYEGCGKTFILGKTLSQHKKSHLKNYICSWPECGQRFSLRPLLDAHINRHQNLKPFKCPHIGCGKGFYIKPQMDHHLRTVHK